MARLEYNWNAEFKKDKRVKEIREACHHLFKVFREIEAKSRDLIQEQQTKTFTAMESSASNTDSENQKVFINPMDDMSEYETASDAGHSHGVDESMESDTPCIVCGLTDNEVESMYCDGCNNVYHTYCAGLLDVPDEEFFCPPCTKTSDTKLMDIFGSTEAADLHSWLVHSSKCRVEERNCMDTEHKAHCFLMKNLLRCTSWALFNHELRGSNVAMKLAQLFAYHAAKCNEMIFCHVPLCNKLKGRKGVKPRVQPLELVYD